MAPILVVGAQERVDHPRKRRTSRGNKKEGSGPTHFSVGRPRTGAAPHKGAAAKRRTLDGSHQAPDFALEEPKAIRAKNALRARAKALPRSNPVQVLGAVLAVLSAATFALTNATARRGVITGTPVQGMVISIPVGLACFLTTALLTGALQSLDRFEASAIVSLSAAGLMHFVLGRYCNYRSSQAAGVNLTAPVIQLNAVVTLVLAVVALREPCTMLQLAGGVLMLAGSLVTQRAPQPASAGKAKSLATFAPRIAAGFFFAAIAAVMYGTTPIIVRLALHDAGPLSGLAGGSIAYGAATAAVAFGLLIPSLRRNVMEVSGENARWFVYSGIFVAAAQGFLYSALAVAPIMLVAPLLQLSLVFRFLFAFMLNPHHEVFGMLVVIGTVVSIAGASAIAIDTDLILHALSVPEALAGFLRSQL
jgi:drug/metabolite transporter (DMT)-like permease